MATTQSTFNLSAKVACFDCFVDERNLAEWRQKGGAMPPKKCQTDHRPSCKKCGKKTEPRASGLCNECYQEKQASKPKGKAWVCVCGTVNAPKLTLCTHCFKGKPKKKAG